MAMPGWQVSECGELTLFANIVGTLEPFGGFSEAFFQAGVDDPDISGNAFGTPGTVGRSH